jgi:hypothetical protein
MIIAASIMVRMGNMVTTMDASMGEVMDNPTKKGSWFSVRAKNDARNNRKMSFAGTCSFLVNSETIQNSNIPPANLKKVRVNGLSISGINALEIGLLIPKIIFAENRATCPVSFLFSIFMNKTAKILSL